jgi:hypothetical protein
MNKFGFVSVLTIIACFSLVVYGFSSSEEEQRAKLAADIELECRGKFTPSFGAPEPAGYRDCITKQRAKVGLD